MNKKQWFILMLESTIVVSAAFSMWLAADMRDQLQQARDQAISYGTQLVACLRTNNALNEAKQADVGRDVTND